MEDILDLTDDEGYDDDPCQLTPYLWLGSRDPSRDREWLDENNVRYIVNLSDSANYFERDKTFKYLQVSIVDSSSTPITKEFDRCFSFIDDAAKKDGVVLVHCTLGVSRSATICIAYMMKTKKWTLKQSCKYIYSKKFIHPNPGFMKQLLEYEKKMYGKVTLDISDYQPLDYSSFL